MTEPADIVGRLSEAQKACLLDHHPYRGSRNKGWPESTRDPHSFAQAGKALMAMRLITWPHDPSDSRTEITPLGLAVRRALMDGDGNG